MERSSCLSHNDNIASIIGGMNQYLLTLVRHAKSSWQTPGQADHDRPLNGRGNRDASIMAQRLLDRGCVPELILCSSALRTRQTAQYFLSAFELDENHLWVEPKLYLSSPETILNEVAVASEGMQHIMVIAHNPGLEQLSCLLSSACSRAMPTLGIRHFSTRSLVTISKPIELLFEDYPKNAIT